MNRPNSSSASGPGGSVHEVVLVLLAREWQRCDEVEVELDAQRPPIVEYPIRALRKPRDHANDRLGHRGVVEPLALLGLIELRHFAMQIVEHAADALTE